MTFSALCFHAPDFLLVIADTKLTPNNWWQILQCLTVQGGDASNSGLSRSTVKDRFKTFNIQFEELHQRQSQWTVPDSELRESLRLAVAEVLLPAYRSFIKRFGHVFISFAIPFFSKTVSA